MAVAEGFYFCPSAANDSFVGYFDNFGELTHCMSDFDIQGYVRASRPDLFHNLRCLPIKTSIVPEDFSSQAVFIKQINHQKLTSVPSADSGYWEANLPGQCGLQLPPSSHQSLLDLQHKRHVQLRLLSMSRLLRRPSSN